MHERNKAYTSSLLAFVDWELRGAYEGIGRELDAAKSYEEAIEAAEPYFKHK